MSYQHVVLMVVNRWEKLSEISTRTKLYLTTEEVERMTRQAAAKIGKIERSKRRMDGQGRYPRQGFSTPPSNPDAVELPGEDVPSHSPMSPYFTSRSSMINRPHSSSSSQDKFVVHSSDNAQPRISAEMPYRHSGEYEIGYDSPNNISPRRSGEDYSRPEPPPIPPKTPMYGDGRGLRPPQSSRLSTGNPKPQYLPYPDFDPPIVNKLRKPQYNPG